MTAKLGKISLLTIILLVLMSTSIWAATTYQYDDLHRLTRVEYSDGSVTVYNYDDLGNRTSKVTAANDTITALFNASPSSGPAPLSVIFTDQSIGTITSWEWDFDNDGTPDSNAQNSSFTYDNVGTYIVRLTVSGPAGSDSETKTIQVEELGEPSLSVTPISRDVPANFGSTSFQVSNSGTGVMPWTVSSSTSWLTVTGGSSGENDGVVTLEYDLNSGASRTGYVTVSAPGATNSPITLTINQAGSGAGPDVSLISPVASALWSLGSTHDIVWQATSASGISQVRLYVENENSSDLIVTFDSNPEQYSWTLPLAASSYVSTNARIRIVVTDGDGIDAESLSSVFTIQDGAVVLPPWHTPEVVLSSDVGNSYSALEVDSSGTVHMVYKHTLDDFSTSERIITQKIMYRTKVGETWSVPVEIYSLTQTTDASSIGYRLLNDFHIVVDSF